MCTYVVFLGGVVIVVELQQLLAVDCSSQMYGSPEGPLIQTLPIARCSYFSLPIAYFSLPIRYTSDFPVPNSVSSRIQFQSLISSKPAAHSCFAHVHSIHNTAIQPVQLDLLAVALN